MINQTSCCGFKEIDGLANRTPEQSLKQVCEDFFNGEDAAFLFFTGVNNQKYGQKFRNLIKRKKLGKIMETEAKRNPNSGNYIRAWIWSVNKSKFKEYAKQHKIEINEYN